jgi:NitT/TauT family transport system substrate-binding protein
MFVAKKKSGIKTLKDFNGKKIGVWRTIAKELITGFLKKNNINAEVILFDKGINVFLKDVVDITVMMDYNEYNRMINSGINPDEITKFYFRDYEMNFPEDGIYCMENTFKSDPDLCKKFVEASIEGWTYALANIDETIEVINKYQRNSNVPYNRSHSLWMLNAMKEMISSSGKKVKVGNLLKSDFDHLVDFLYANKFINIKPLYGDFYKGNI